MNYRFSYESLEIERRFDMVYLVIAVVAGILLAFLGTNIYNNYSDFIECLGMIITVVSACVACIAFLVVAVCGWSWQSSKYKADIINREYNTQYTRQEIFYASDVIDTVRELDRKRIELNGDLLNK